MSKLAKENINKVCNSYREVTKPIKLHVKKNALV